MSIRDVRGNAAGVVVALLSPLLGCFDADPPVERAAYAQALGAEAVQLNVESALAGAAYHDACLDIDLEVPAEHDVLRKTGAEVLELNTANVILSGSDRCAGIVFGSPQQVIEDAFSGDLDAATIAATFDTQYRDATTREILGTMPVVLHVDLVGIGEPTEYSARDTVGDCPDCTIYHFTQLFRDAESTVQFTLDGDTIPVTPSTGRLGTYVYRSASP